MTSCCWQKVGHHFPGYASAACFASYLALCFALDCIVKCVCLRVHAVPSHQLKLYQATAGCSVTPWVGLQSWPAQQAAYNSCGGSGVLSWASIPAELTISLSCTFLPLVIGVLLLLALTCVLHHQQSLCSTTQAECICSLISLSPAINPGALEAPNLFWLA